MLVDFSKVDHTYLVCGFTDLRKGIDSLASLVQSHYQLDLYDNAVFLFCGRRTDRFKALHFDGEGFLLLYKRYDSGKLKWPRSKEEITELSSKQLSWLFDGFSVDQQPGILPTTARTLL